MPAERPYPRFRRDLVVRRIVESGDAAWTVHDPLRSSYFRHDTLTHDVCELLDGERGPSEVQRAIEERYPQFTFSREWVDELVDDLKRGGFLEESFHMNEIQRARAKEARKRFSPGSLKNIFNIQFGVLDPTPAFRLVYPLVRVMFTRPFVLASVFAFFVACGLIWDRRDALVGGLMTIFTLQNSSWLGLLILYVILFLIVVAHEFGHGLCCTHFGGQPRRLGFMLFYLMPGMFCDVSDIYFFEKRWHRAAVALAGGYVEVLCFTAATFLWVATPPDLLIHEIAYRVMLFSGVTGLVFNYNPLIKLDGYYVLMSWLDMPDLRERSFKYLSDLFRGKILRLPVTPERLVRREKRAFLIYGLTAMLYSVSYAWIMLLFLRGILVGNFREAGFLVFAAFFFYMTRKWWLRLWQGGRYLALEKGGWVRRHLALAGSLGALLIVLLLVPWPHRVQVEARLEPIEIGRVTAPYDGRIEDVLATEGQPVRHGTVLAVVRPATSPADGIDGGETADPTAERRVRELEATRVETTFREDERARRGLSTYAALPIARARADEARALERRSWLVSPVSGHVLSTRPGLLVGEPVTAGEEILKVGAIDTLAIVLVGSERLIGDLEPGQMADLRLRADPGRRIRFAIQNIDLAPLGEAVLSRPTGELVDTERAASRFAARGRIANPGAELRPGMSGVARVRTRPLNLLQRFGRTYARIVRADFWL